MSKATISTLAVASTAALALYLVNTSSASKTEASNSILLVGDIGGTNTRLALYKPGKTSSLFEREYLNSQFITDGSKTFEKEIFVPFLNDSNISFADKSIVACFAVAGPVKGNCVFLTNLGGDLSTSDPESWSCP